MGRDFKSFSDPGLLPCSGWGSCEFDFTMTVLFLLPLTVFKFRRRLGKLVDRDYLRSSVVAFDCRPLQKVSARKGEEAVQSCSRKADRAFS
jgi:hypothetical protein